MDFYRCELPVFKQAFYQQADGFDHPFMKIFALSVVSDSVLVFDVLMDICLIKVSKNPTSDQF